MRHQENELKNHISHLKTQKFEFIEQIKELEKEVEQFQNHLNSEIISNISNNERKNLLETGLILSQFIICHQ
jgi:flagellar biosynthesis chaperone FliJ